MSRITDNPCFVPANSPDQIMAIVRELRSKGLMQSYDFDFKWIPRATTNYYVNLPKGAEFTFKDAKWATLFRIKYGGNT
jgi:hypothetical protein